MIPPTRSDVLLGFIAENRPFVVTAFLLMAAWSFFLLAPGTPGSPRKMSYLQEPAAAGDNAPGQITEIPKTKRYASHRKLRLVRRS